MGSDPLVGGPDREPLDILSLARLPELPDVEAERPAPKPACTRSRNYTWADLMKRVFLVDVLQCERCGGRMKILAAIHPPDTTRKILECLGLPTRAPPLASAVSSLTLHLESF